MTTLRICSALLLLAPLAPAQTWTQRFPVTIPPIGFAGAMAYDIAHGKAVHYGGTSGWAGSDETWEWDGTNWTRYIHHPSPGELDSHTMTYDSGRSLTILWGGWDSLQQTQTDTWEYDGFGWSRNNTPNSPPGLLGSKMVYDVARGRTVLFGGRDHANATVTDQTWEFDGNDWTRIVTPTVPPARSLQAMAYDTVRGVVVMFGGWHYNAPPPLGDTWEYDGTDWRLITTVNSPTPRYSLDGSFDTARGVMVIHGGLTGAGLGSETWEYDGNDWTLVSNSGPGRSYHSQVYDPARGKMVIYGGFDLGSSSLTRETWEYTGQAVARWVAFGAGCPGSAGIPALAPRPGSLPALGTTFDLELTNLPAAGGLCYMAIGLSNTSWNGIPLPLVLSQFGLSGCTAYVAPDVGVVLVHTGGGVTWSFPLPNNQALAGLRYFNQGVSFDLGAANGQAAVSNAGASTVN